MSGDNLSDITAAVDSAIEALRQHKAEVERLAEVNADLVAALQLLLNDVQDYEAWQRPCYAVARARAALAKAKGEQP